MFKWTDVEQNSFMEIKKLAALDVLPLSVKSFKFTQTLERSRLGDYLNNMVKPLPVTHTR